MFQIIFLAISLYVLFRILNGRKSKKTRNNTDLGKTISNWKKNGGEEMKQEPLYSSRHETTPSNEKDAERIVSKHEKIAREALRNEESK